MPQKPFKIAVPPAKLDTDSRVKALKAKVRAANRKLAGSDFRFQLRLSPRLGKDNPNRWKYNNRFKPRLRIEDADEVVVYVGTRRVP